MGAQCFPRPPSITACTDGPDRETQVLYVRRGPAASPPVPSDPFEADEVIAALHREDEKLPKPQELIASACDFAERPLAGQRKFAEDVPKATAQVLAGQDDILAKKNGSAAK